MGTRPRGACAAPRFPAVSQGHSQALSSKRPGLSFPQAARLVGRSIFQADGEAAFDASGGDLGLQDGRLPPGRGCRGLGRESGHPVTIAPGKPSRPSGRSVRGRAGEKTKGQAKARGQLHAAEISIS
jgi:hypothetical protein